MNDKNKYKEEIIRATQLWERGDITRENLEYIFPELREDEDEKIRKDVKRAISVALDYSYFDKETANNCLAWLENQGKEECALKSSKDEDVRKFIQYIEKEAKAYEFNLPNRSYDIYAFAKDILVWLEKQGDQKPIDNVESKFKVGDWIVSSVLGTAHIIGVNDSNEYQLEYIDGKQKFSSIDYVNYEYDEWIIQDAKDGDVLAFNNDTIVIFKNLYNSSTFHSYCHIEDGIFDISKDELPDWWEGKGFQPATKEQRDLFFQRMKEAGYEWDTEKKELKKIVKPKFKVGDWCIDNEDDTIFQIVKVLDNTYAYKTIEGKEYSCTHYLLENYARLWIIQDAKDGDVLCCESGWTCIFKALNSDNISFSSYCFMDNTGWFCETGSESHTLDKAFIKAYNGNIYPATKEQRDLLFQKMKDAGYEWNKEKNELRKIEQKPNDRLDPLIDDEIDLWIKENSNIHHNNNDIVELMRNMAYYVANLTRNLYR